MKALFGGATAVPLGRVTREYRAWMIPIVVLLAVVVGVLVLVVLPMAATADAAERRAAAAAEEQKAAYQEFTSAERTRDAQAQAAQDLDRFYRQVLPPDVASARKSTHLKLSQLARTNSVTFQSSASSPEVVRGSTLERLRVSYSLSGDYDDIRRLLHEIETAADFIVIDNVFLQEGQGGQAPLALTLELSTYYRAAANAR